MLVFKVKTNEKNEVIAKAKIKSILPHVASSEMRDRNILSIYMAEKIEVIDEAEWEKFKAKHVVRQSDNELWFESLQPSYDNEYFWIASNID